MILYLPPCEAHSKIYACISRSKIKKKTFDVANHDIFLLKIYGYGSQGFSPVIGSSPIC